MTWKPLKSTRENIKYKAYTTMNKLIKVAEELYKQIDKAQVHLINARLNNDEEGKKSAISEMQGLTTAEMFYRPQGQHC